MRPSSRLQPLSFMRWVWPYLLALISLTNGFMFSSPLLSLSDTQVNVAASYTVILARSYDDSLNPTSWDDAPLPSSATVTVVFPSQFESSQLTGVSCDSILVNFNPVTGFTCTISGNTLTVGGLFNGIDKISQVDLFLSNIINPSSALTTSPFTGTIGSDVSGSSSIASLTYSPSVLAILTASFIGGIVNRTSDLIVTLTTGWPIPSNGAITIRFPGTLLWARQISTTNLIPINGALSCYGLTSSINNASILCAGSFSTQTITISSPFSTAIAIGTQISFGIKGLFAPPTVQQIDTLTVSTCDNLLHLIESKGTTISGLVAQTMTSFNVRSSLPTPMGVNNFAGGLTFTFSITDTIGPKDTFLIIFPTGSTISFMLATSTVRLLTPTIGTLFLEISQNSSNPILNAGSTITLTFVRFRAPPSIKPSSPITFSIQNTGHTKMQGSGSITAIANNYTLTATASSLVVNAYTNYILSFTTTDALTSSGFIVIILDPLLCASSAQVTTITTNLTISISGSSIRSTPSTQISEVSVNGSAAYQLKLSSLNTSSSNIPAQTITITIRNILNPPSVRAISTFSGGTYYSSEADLVANLVYSGSIILQTGALSLLSIDSSVTKTYSFTTITLKCLNTNPIPANGVIMLSIPSDISLLAATISQLMVGASLISATTSNIVSNNTIQLVLGSQISAGQTISILISNIMTQNSTKPTSIFTLSSFDSAFRGIDQSSNNLSLIISGGNNFNALSVTPSDFTNSKNVNYTIVFEQIQSFTSVTVVSFLFSSTLSTSSLSRVYEVTSGSTQTPCLFTKTNTSYLVVTLSSSISSTRTIILQTIGNPPSLAPLSFPIKVTTLTGDKLYIYSEMYTQDIITSTLSKLNVVSFSFSSYVFSQSTDLTLNIKGTQNWPDIVYKITIDIPMSIETSSFVCTSLTSISCSIFSPTNTLTVTASTGLSLPFDLLFTISSLKAPAFGSSTQYFSLSTFDENGFGISSDSSTVTFLNNCSLQCRTCESTNGSLCQSCYSPSMSNYSLLYGKQCLAQCPTNTYESALICIDCDANCASCSNYSGNCTACSSPLIIYFNVTSWIGSCFDSCPSTTYNENNSCLSCPSTCLDCQSSSYCYNCTAEYFLYKGTCLSFCPNGTLTVLGNYSCYDCQSPCKTCSESISNCITCQAFTVLYNGTCSSNCPSSNLYITANQTCQLCSSLCATCSMQNYNCTSCNLGSNVSHLYSNQCLKSCPQLYYSQMNTSVCLQCSSLGIGCNNCSSQSTCLVCDPGKLFFPANSSCLSSAPTGYFDNNGTLLPCNSSCSSCQDNANDCSSCSGSLNLYNNSCIDSCPSTTHIAQNNTCVACTYPCLTCINSTIICLSCYANSSLYFSASSYSCLPASLCPNQTFANNISISCDSCDTACKVCLGSNSNCSQCSNGNYLNQANFTCSFTCPNGTIPLQNASFGGICTACQQPCSTCSENISNCLACSQYNSSLFLSDNGSCVGSDGCNKGFYPETSTYQCTACISPCLQCSSPATCISCQANYSLITSNNTCSTVCPNGYAPHSSNNSSICTVCSYPCSSCFGSIFNCSSCDANSSLFLQNNRCVNSSECSQGTYADTGNYSCVTCSFECQACYSNINCTLCAVGFFYDGNWACVKAQNCVNGTVAGYNSSSGRNQCVSCSYPCSLCSLTPLNCTSCQQSNFSMFLSNWTCVNSSSCTIGKYADNTTFSCVSCLSPCITCSSKQVCSSCIQDYYLINNTCSSLCPNGTYVFNQTGIILCSACEGNCSTCSHSSLNCTSCSSGYLLNFTCINQTSCPAGTYANNSTLTCSACQSPCIMCGSATSCLSCNGSLALFPDNGTCLSICPNSTILQTINGVKICKGCSENCINCIGSSSFCTSCSNSSLYLLNGTCYTPQTCPNGTYPSNITKTCSSCPSSCSACSSLTICQTCKLNFYYSNGSCASNCPNSTIAVNSSTSGICQSCQYPCATCKGTTTTCLSCSNSTLYFLNGTCYTPQSCPNGTYPSNTTKTCTTCTSPCSTCFNSTLCSACKSNFYFINGSCGSTCPAGTIAVNSSNSGICETCQQPCATCKGTTTTCLSCSNSTQTFYYNNSCINASSCPLGTFADASTLLCKTCITPCVFCISNLLCLSCKVGLFLSNFSCVSQCSNGYFSTNISGINVCSSCDTICLTCSGSSTNCLSCNKSSSLLFLFNKTCVSNSSCPIGTYGNTVTSKCQSCSIKCTACSSINNCSSCSNSFYLFGNTCSTTCPKGYYENSQGNTCTFCENNCSSCGNATYCLSCSSPLVLTNGSCQTSCPSSTPYNINNVCKTCRQSIANCVQCTDTPIPSCLQCDAGLTLVGGSCETKDTLTSTLTGGSIFPLPFTITGTLLFVACFMSKLQNSNSYVVGTAYSLFGVLETTSLVTTILIYANYLRENISADDLSAYLQGALVAIAILNLFSLFLHCYQLTNDQKFQKWVKSRCNYICYIIFSIISCLMNYKVKMMLFSRLFSFQCLRAQLDSVQKFRLFNVLSFLGVAHQGLVIYITALLLVDLPFMEQPSLALLDLLIINLFNVILALAASKKQQNFFQEQQQDGVRVNKVYNIEQSHNIPLPQNGLTPSRPQGLQSRDALAAQQQQDDDEFTLSISERRSSYNGDSFASNNGPLDSQGNHQQDTGNSLRKRGKQAALDLYSNSFSAVYQGDLPKDKRKQFENNIRIAPDIPLPRSKDASSKAKNDEQKIANEFFESNKQGQGDLVGGNLPAESKPTQDLGSKQYQDGNLIDKDTQQVEIHQNIFDFNQQSADDQIDLALPVVIPTNNLQQQQQGQVEQVQISEQKQASGPVSQRQIKIYKGRASQAEGDDIEQIDLTISKKQRELIELRKAIKKKERDRQRSQQRRSVKRDNSKDSKSKDIRSERPPRQTFKNSQQLSKTPQLQVNQNMEGSFIEEHILAPIQNPTPAPKKKDLLYQKDIPDQAIPVDKSKLFEAVPIIHVHPIQQNLQQGKKIQTANNQVNQKIPQTINSPLKQTQKNNPTQEIQQGIPQTKQDGIKTGIKVDYMQVEKELQSKYEISPRGEQDQYQIQEMDFQYKQSDTKRDKQQSIKSNIFFQRDRQETPSPTPPQKEFLKTAGFISHPHTNKIVQPSQSSNISQLHQRAQFFIGQDNENNPLESRMQRNRKGALGARTNSAERDEDQERGFAGNRSHLLKQDSSTGKIAEKLITQQSRLKANLSGKGAEFGQTLTARGSQKDLTERKLPRHLPPQPQQRPATTEKSRMYIAGLQQIEGITPNSRQLPSRTSQESYGLLGSSGIEQGDSRFQIYPSTFSSNRIRPQTEQYIGQPKKPNVASATRRKPYHQPRESSNLQDSFARKSMKSYKSRSIDRQQYLGKQQEDNGDLNEYYKRNKDSPSNRSRKSKSGSRSRSRERSSDKKISELEKIYLQRLQFKK